MDMDHGDMGSNGPSCKISMLWNWTTIDSCFLASTWHVRSDGAFAASCIGVVLLVVVLELLRRTGKEYDSYILRQFKQNAMARVAQAVPPNPGCESGPPDAPAGADIPAANDREPSLAQYLTFRPSVGQQLIRSVIHMCTFAVAYIVMLLAMYFNGYIIISIFLGALIGKFGCDWVSIRIAADGRVVRGGGKDEQELTYCCG